MVSYVAKLFRRTGKDETFGMKKCGISMYGKYGSGFDVALSRRERISGDCVRSRGTLSSKERQRSRRGGLGRVGKGALAPCPRSFRYGDRRVGTLRFAHPTYGTTALACRSPLRLLARWREQ